MVKIPTWSTRSSLIKALQPTQQKKQRVLLEWNRHLISFLRSGPGSSSLIEWIDMDFSQPHCHHLTSSSWQKRRSCLTQCTRWMNEGLLNEKRNPPLERKKDSILYLTIPASPSFRLTWRLNGLMIHQRAQANSKRLRSIKGKLGKVSQVSVQIEDFFHKGERTNQDKNNQTRRTSWDEPQAPKEGHSQKILLRENQVWYKQFLTWDNNWR